MRIFGKKVSSHCICTKSQLTATNESLGSMEELKVCTADKKTALIWLISE